MLARMLKEDFKAVRISTENPGGTSTSFVRGCGHRIGKLTHPQTKAGPKTDPFSDYLQ